MSARRLTPWFLALSVFAAAPSAQSPVWTVDDSPFPLTSFADIQSAVDAASDGDMIVIREGTYSSFTVDGKSLEIVASAPDHVLLRDSFGFPSTVTVRNLSSGQEVLLRGLHVLPDYSFSAAPGILVEDCQGSVFVEDCTATGNVSTALGFPQSGGPGAAVIDCASVTIVRSTFEGRMQASSGHQAGAMPGLEIQGSDVQLYGCSLVGGVAQGAAANPIVPCTATFPPAPGCRVNGGFLYAADTRFVGRNAGAGGSIPGVAAGAGGDGGDGLAVVGASTQVVLLACSFVAGAGGPAGNGSTPCEQGTDGLPIAAPDGTVTQLPGRAHATLTDAELHPLSHTQIFLEGDPGEVGLIGLSPSQSSPFLPSFGGVLHVLTSNVTFVAGVFPDNGVIALGFTLGNFGQTDTGTTLYAQSAVVTGTGSLVLGSPSTLVFTQTSF